MKEFIRLGGTLAAIVAITVFLLSFFNRLTSEKISQNEQLKLQQAMNEILPGDEYNEVEEGIYQVIANNQQIGYCVQVTETGYGGDIVMLVAVKTDKNIGGISIISAQETPGLGAKIAEDNFLAQFIDQPKPTEIQAITGATISSNAVKRGIEKAYKLLEE